MRFYNRLNMKKKINKVQELKSSRVPESTLEPLNPVNVEPLKHGWRWVSLGEVCKINPPRPKNLTRPPGAPTTFVPMAVVDERTATITKSEVVP